MPVVIDINSAHENVIVVSINSASKNGATAQDKVLAGKVASAIVSAANNGKVPSIAKSMKINSEQHKTK